MDAKKRKKLGTVLIVVGVTALICMIFFLIFGGKLLLNPKYQLEPEQNEPTVSAASSDSISIPGMESMKIQANSKNITVDLYNPDTNNCYFEISILLDNGEQEIYKSALMKPGQHLYEIEISKALSAGTYEAVLHYNTYSTDGSYTPQNGANVPFTLIAE